MIRPSCSSKANCEKGARAAAAGARFAPSRGGCPPATLPGQATRRSAWRWRLGPGQRTTSGGRSAAASRGPGATSGGPAPRGGPARGSTRQRSVRGIYSAAHRLGPTGRRTPLRKGRKSARRRGASSCTRSASGLGEPSRRQGQPSPPTTTREMPGRRILNHDAAMRADDIHHFGLGHCQEAADDADLLPCQAGRVIAALALNQASARVGSLGDSVSTRFRSACGEYMELPDCRKRSK